MYASTTCYKRLDRRLYWTTKLELALDTTATAFGHDKTVFGYGRFGQNNDMNLYIRENAQWQTGKLPKQWLI